jgi:hypothetical protein
VLDRILENIAINETAEIILVEKVGRLLRRTVLNGVKRGTVPRDVHHRLLVHRRKVAVGETVR